MNKPSIKLNYILNTAYQILVLIVPLITTPYISRILGAEGIGVYSYTYSIVSYFLLVATMGTTTFGQRTIAYYQEHLEQRSVKFFEILIFRVTTSIICIILYIYYLLFIVQTNRDIAIIQIIYLISVVFDITWFFQGMEDFKRIVVRNSIIKILNILLLFIFVKRSNDIWIYTLILAGMTLIGNISVWVYIPNYIKKVPIKSLRPFKNFKEIFLLFIPTIAVQIYTVLDKTMIGFIATNISENGYYEQTEKIVRVAIAIVTSLGTVMIPRIAKVFAEQNYDLMKKYLRNSYRFIWFLSIPFMFGLIGICKIFVPVFFGEGYKKVQILIPIYSTLIVAVSLSNVTGLQFLIPTKRQNIYTFAVSFSALLNIILNIIFIPRFLSIGAAFASVLAEYVGALIMIYYVQKKNEISISLVFKDSLNNWIAGSIMFLILLFISNILTPNLISLSMLIALGGIIYLLVLILLKDQFTLENINYILHKIKILNIKTDRKR